MDQVDSLNITYSALNEYKELYDSLKSTLIGYELVITKDKNIIQEYKDIQEINEQIISDKNLIINEERSDKETAQKQAKSLKGWNKALLILSTLLGVAAIL